MWEKQAWLRCRSFVGRLLRLSYKTGLTELENNSVDMSCPYQKNGDNESDSAVSLSWKSRELTHILIEYNFFFWFLADFRRMVSRLGSTLNTERFTVKSFPVITLILELPQVNWRWLLRWWSYQSGRYGTHRWLLLQTIRRARCPPLWTKRAFSNVYLSTSKMVVLQWYTWKKGKLTILYEKLAEVFGGGQIAELKSISVVDCLVSSSADASKWETIPGEDQWWLGNSRPRSDKLLLYWYYRWKCRLDVNTKFSLIVFLDNHIAVVGPDNIKGVYEKESHDWQKTTYKEVVNNRETLLVEDFEQLNGVYEKRGDIYVRQEPTQMFLYQHGRKKWWYFNINQNNKVGS